MGCWGTGWGAGGGGPGVRGAGGGGKEAGEEGGAGWGVLFEVGMGCHFPEGLREGPLVRVPGAEAGSPAGPGLCGEGVSSLVPCAPRKPGGRLHPPVSPRHGLLVRIRASVRWVRICSLGGSPALWRGQSKVSQGQGKSSFPLPPLPESWGGAPFVSHSPPTNPWPGSGLLNRCQPGSLEQAAGSCTPPRSPARVGRPPGSTLRPPRLLRESQLTTMQVTHGRNRFLLMPGKVGLKLTES